MVALQEGKMNQVLHCDWVPKWGRWDQLTQSGLLILLHEKTVSSMPYNKSLICQANLVKMAGYWH